MDPREFRLRRWCSLGLCCLAAVIVSGGVALAQQPDLLAAKPVYGQPPVWNGLRLGESTNADVVARLGPADTTLDAGRTVLQMYGQHDGGDARVTVIVWDNIVHIIQIQPPDDERTLSAVRDKFGKPSLTFEGESTDGTSPRLSYAAYPERGVVFSSEAGSSGVWKLLVSDRALRDLQDGTAGGR